MNNKGGVKDDQIDKLDRLVELSQKGQSPKGSATPRIEAKIEGVPKTDFYQLKWRKEENHN